jgi:hypothetical protein
MNVFELHVALTSEIAKGNGNKHVRVEGCDMCMHHALGVKSDYFPDEIQILITSEY